MMLETIIKDKLNKLKLKYKPSGDGWLLAQCLNPAHIDGNPSMSVNLLTGVCKCFTCGFYTDKHYFLTDDIDEHILEDIKRRSEYYQLKKRFKKMEDGLTSSLGLPIKSKEVSEGYRGLNNETITKFGLYICEVGKYKDRVIFPITDTAFTSRAIKQDVKPKYLHSKGFDNYNELYPYKILKDVNTSYVVLVEGILDCISLWQEGIPSICNFGVSTDWQSGRIEKLLRCGIDTIYVMFDKDKEGNKATAKILQNEELTEYFILKKAEELEEFKEFYTSSCKDYNEFITNRS